MDAFDQSETVDADTSRRLISSFHTAPNGVLTTASSAIPWLVGEQLQPRCGDDERAERRGTLCSRSSNDAALELIPDQIAALSHAFGFVARKQASYPG